MREREREREREKERERGEREEERKKRSRFFVDEFELSEKKQIILVYSTPFLNHGSE